MSAVMLPLTLHPYPAYKPSGISWLGDVPAHWEVVQLGRVGVFFKGSGGTKDDEVPDGIPCVRYGDLYTTHKFFISQTRSFVSPAKASMYTPINRGDVLFPTSGETIEEIGKSAVNLMHTQVHCGGDLVVFRPTIPMEPKFAGYALDCPAAQTQKSLMGRGITIMHIYSGQLKYLWLSLPAPAEQRAIVRYLDYVDRRIRRYVSAKRKLIALLEEEKQTIVNQAVTRGLHPEQALSLDEQARSMAQEAASPLELTWAVVCSAWLHQQRGEWQLVHEPAARGLGLAAEHGLSFPSAVAGVLQGWALARQGQTEHGIEQIRQGLTRAQDTGNGWGRPYLLGLLADAYGLAGQTEQGLDALVEALGIIRTTDERFCEPELYRLRGELLLARERGPSSPQAPSSEAEDCLLLAIKIARRQSAKSWELRAALSLSRLWQRQGKTQQAQHVLESVYGWFSEGLDTPDAQEARATLTALG